MDIDKVILDNIVQHRTSFRPHHHARYCIFQLISTYTLHTTLIRRTNTVHTTNLINSLLVWGRESGARLITANLSGICHSLSAGGGIGKENTLMFINHSECVSYNASCLFKLIVTIHYVHKNLVSIC